MAVEHFFVNIVINTPAVSSTLFWVDTHLCKLRDTPAARLCRCVIL